MADSIASIIDLIHPTASGVGIVLSDQVWVVFDREMDESSLSNGNFFVAGPDFDTWSGPDLQVALDSVSVGTEEEILQSPGYHGIVKGVFSFERLDLSTYDEVDQDDTIGSGILYRTKAIFTPNERLSANTEYTVYLSGDESPTDDNNAGVLSRTIFDYVASGTNTGTGSIELAGSYNGLLSPDTYRLIVTTSGDWTTAKFTFQRDSDPLTVYGPFKTRQSGVSLSDGVIVKFTDGTYDVGDQWSFVVKEPSVFENNLIWTFKTGSGSIEQIPDTVSTSVIATTVGGTGIITAPETFEVLSTRPLDFDTNLPVVPGPYTITVNFNSDIDSTTVVSGVSLSLSAEPVLGWTTDGTYPPASAYGSLPYATSVSGQQLTITVASGAISSNNLVTVLLDPVIKNTSGLFLNSGYEFSFTTSYSPMYCSARRLRLQAGQYLQGIPDDTLNMAINLSSLESDERTWNKDNMEDSFYHFVRSEWTCCRAAQYLLTNVVGGPGKPKSKKLGDLAVEYDTTAANVAIPLDRIQQCLDKWEGELTAGGRKVQSPNMVVRGENDIDRPPVGRRWLHTRDWLNTQTPAANLRVRPSLSRRVRSAYGHRGWYER